MKSKEILPEDLRFSGEDHICWTEDAKQGKYSDISEWIKRHTDALLAAESEIEEKDKYIENLKESLREDIAHLKKELPIGGGQGEYFSGVISEKNAKEAVLEYLELVF